jgi:hypothetical protein
LQLTATTELDAGIVRSASAALRPRPLCGLERGLLRLGGRLREIAATHGDERD